MITQTHSQKDHSVAADLTRVLFDGQFDQIHRPWRDFFSTSTFHHRELPSEERMVLSYERLRHLNKLLLDSPHGPESLAQDPSRLTALHEWVGPVDPGLGTILTIHYNLFLGSLTKFADSNGYDLRPFVTMDRTGVFLCTERSYGNNAPQLETTSTWDPAGREFVLHTPGPGAAKFMPNTSSTGGPKTALVAARLIVAEQDEGVHLFLVDLHNDATGESLPGISIERLPQTASAPVDHCMTTFTHVRLPYKAMVQSDRSRLTPEGIYTSTIGGALKRFHSSVGRVTDGKLCMQASLLGTTRHALTVAIRYAHIRHTSSGTRGGSVPLWHHRSHHAPLLEALATAYAATFLHRSAVRSWEQALTAEERADAERLAAITKGWITWRGREVMDECRERCGAQGLFLANGIAFQRAAGEGAITAEGDNKVIWIKAGMELVLGHFTGEKLRPHSSDLSDPESLQELLGDIARIWRDRAAERLRGTTRITDETDDGDARPGSRSRRPGNTLRRTVLPALRLVDSFAPFLAAREMLRAAQQASTPEARRLLYALHRLFALHHIAAHTGDLVTEGFLTSNQVRTMHDTIELVLDELEPNGLLLANAQAVSETLLLSHPIMAADPDHETHPALAVATGAGVGGRLPSSHP
ncbi:acyl-CoA dehydrogenase [Streptomyces sp. BE147]|uniref:acyl-CoA dehydrogenase family protein n=1 Tax=Streptomyces sp. BE147 TaxID=3002524 RepID=UPI002E7965C6|nr:acyl-CoA dehydrogenase [Streptomyces sp. BE147]MEE1737042.1 acyl-CoA dehydrogenase [Streptomyces sp. BE147]